MKRNAIAWASLAIVAMACSACSTTPTRTATFVTPASQQVAALNWEEVTSASTTVKVNNTSLIFMR